MTPPTAAGRTRLVRQPTACHVTGSHGRVQPARRPVDPAGTAQREPASQVAPPRVDRQAQTPHHGHAATNARAAGPRGSPPSAAAARRICRRATRRARRRRPPTARPAPRTHRPPPAPSRRSAPTRPEADDRPAGPGSTRRPAHQAGHRRPTDVIGVAPRSPHRTGVPATAPRDCRGSPARRRRPGRYAAAGTAPDARAGTVGRMAGRVRRRLRTGLPVRRRWDWRRLVRRPDGSARPPRSLTPDPSPADVHAGLPGHHVRRQDLGPISSRCAIDAMTSAVRRATASRRRQRPSEPGPAACGDHPARPGRVHQAAVLAGISRQSSRPWPAGRSRPAMAPAGQGGPRRAMTPPRHRAG